MADNKTVEILNSYDNTEELLKKFTVMNPTPVETDMEKKIQNRLLTGFENWNRGTEAWMAWGDILYTPDSLYNLHGVHMTLKEYQMSSALAFKTSEVMMGDFHNMLICGDWTAIHYDTAFKNKETGEIEPGSVMEFVKFKEQEETGTTVEEGWAGVRSHLYPGMLNFLTEEEREAQNAAMAAVEAYELPDTDDLAKKYIVKYPTPDNSPMADEIKQAILSDFENWNKGIDHWCEWAENYYAEDYTYHVNRKELNLEQLKDAKREEAAKNEVTRLYFDSMLISGDWAAIHYHLVNKDQTTGERTAGDGMEFLHFVKDGDGVKVTESWV